MAIDVSAESEASIDVSEPNSNVAGPPVPAPNSATDRNELNAESGTGSARVLDPTTEKDEPAAKLEVGSVVGGRYRLERELARGGMGTVWVGRDEQLDRAVAIKFMDPEIASNKAHRQRFKQEAKAAAGLDTPHVVQIYEYGFERGLPYIVMELLRGEDLHARLKRVKRVNFTMAARVVVQIARALRQAHAVGIVHRDLKPANIFLQQCDDQEEIVKVLDFGVAKVAGATSEDTKRGLVLGSVNYFSPEQARGLPLDARSDLWALAAVLFRMLTGKRAFKGRTDGDVAINICTDPLPVPSQVAPDLPESVDRFFVVAFQRDPAHRFQSAAEFAAEFVRIVSDFTDEPPSRLSDSFGPGSVERQLALSAASLAAEAQLSLPGTAGGKRPPTPRDAVASSQAQPLDERRAPSLSRPSRQQALMIGGGTLLIATVVALFVMSSPEPKSDRNSVDADRTAPAASPMVSVSSPAEPDQATERSVVPPPAETVDATPSASAVPSATPTPTATVKAAAPRPRKPRPRRPPKSVYTF